MGKQHDKAYSVQDEANQSGKGRLAFLSKWVRKNDGMTKRGPAQQEASASAVTKPAQKKAKMVLVPKRTFKQRLALFAIKWLAILLSFFLATVIGAVIGFGLLGGEDWKLALKWETWKHIYNLVFSN